MRTRGYIGIILALQSGAAMPSVLTEARVAADMTEYAKCAQKVKALEEKVLSRIPTPLMRWDRKLYHLTQGARVFDAQVALVTDHLKHSEAISPDRFVAANGAEGCERYYTIVKHHLRWAAAFWTSVALLFSTALLRRCFVGLHRTRPPQDRP